MILIKSDNGAASADPEMPLSGLREISHYSPGVGSNRSIHHFVPTPKNTHVKSLLPTYKHLAHGSAGSLNTTPHHRRGSQQQTKQTAHSTNGKKRAKKIIENA